MKAGSLFAGMFAGWLMMVIIVMGICGVIGMYVWPYTVNTWGEYFNMDEGEEWNPIGKWGGFWMGVCPVIGQIQIPAVIITGVCDMIFIPD